MEHNPTQADNHNHRIAVCIPTYNNGRTIGAVAAAAAALCDTVIVVDDGSTDETRDMLTALGAINVIRFERNRGKGCALRAGMERAAQMGCTHVITLDADGQHMPEDIVLFIDRIRIEPDTLWIGNRVIPAGGAEAPARSKFGRKFGNFWYRFNTGIALHDTQCGFRAYPLTAIRALDVKGRRYEFEQDVLIKSAWSGVPVKEVDIHLKYQAGGERISHFRPFRDFLRISAVNAKAAFLRVAFPVMTFDARGKTLREKIGAMVRYELKAHATPKRAAFSLALGVFMGLFPIHGFQVATLMGLAVALRLNRPLAFLGVCISSPPLLPIIIIAALAVGRLCVPQRLIRTTLPPALQAVFQGGVEFVVGSVILAFLVSVIVFLTAYPLFVQMRRNRKSE